MNTCGCLNSDDVLELAAGAMTYRQLNYWTSHLRIIPAHRHSGKPARRADDRHPLADGGSGMQIGWDPQDAERAVWIARLVAATGMAPKPAAALRDADITIDTPEGRFQLQIRPLPDAHREAA